MREPNEIAPGHPWSLRPVNGLATRVVLARVQQSQPLKTKKGPPRGDPFLFLVEAAGVEPASASTLPLALHA